MMTLFAVRRSALTVQWSRQYGVPQGSVLGLILFVLYTAEIGRVVAQHGLKFYQYAEDCEIYVATSVSAVHSAIDYLSRCLHDVDVWMSASRLGLRLNASKTQVLWLGSRHNIDRLIVHEVPVLSSTVGVVGSARDLGVVIVSRLSMADHVVSVYRSAYYHLRQIRPTLQSLSRDAANTIVQAFISSRLDYLQLSFVRRHRQLTSTTAVCIQNAAARLITQTGRREHILPVLPELHWLPVRRHVDFKLATLMFKSLHGCAPSYLSDACKSAHEASRVSDRLAPSHASYRGPELIWATGRLMLPDRGFGTSCLLHCGRLTVCQFRRQLKTFLFVKDLAAAPSDFCFYAPDINTLTYLLTFLLTLEFQYSVNSGSKDRS